MITHIFSPTVTLNDFLKQVSLMRLSQASFRTVLEHHSRENLQTINPLCGIEIFLQPTGRAVRSLESEKHTYLQHNHTKQFFSHLFLFLDRLESIDCDKTSRLFGSEESIKPQRPISRFVPFVFFLLSSLSQLPCACYFISLRRGGILEHTHTLTYTHIRNSFPLFRAYHFVLS